MFTNALRRFVRERFGQDFGDPEKLHFYFQSLKIVQKRQAWITIGMYANSSKDKAHDYYHNTWSKQFYTSLSAYREEMNELIQANTKSDPAETVQAVISQLKLRHPGNLFHTRSLYQMVHFTVTQKQGLIKDQQNDKMIQKLSSLLDNYL